MLQLLEPPEPLDAMATPNGGIIRQFTQGVLDRITGRAQTAAVDPASGTTATTAEMQAGFSGARQYFGPGMPLRPVAPAGSTTGRAFDYASYVNTTYTPRGEPGQGGIGFATLRRMATPAEGGLDLLRLAIETRKDQMVAQRWTIRGRAKNDDGGKRARALEQLLRRPDGVMTFRTWLRVLLEDHYVIDAPTIFYSADDKRPLLEIMDGGTIKRLIDQTGRTPKAPLPAYQQILKGTPADDYTIDELGYYVSNPVSYRLYGISRVEQVIVTINMAIQRALSQLDYFTEGTTPDGFIEVPENWTIEQIQQYSEWFNSILTGQTGERRRLQFVPKGANYKPTKDPTLKDQFDEWMARVICFCFSLPPQALVKETNRSTAETNKEAAAEEGLEPDKLWFKDVMDDALERIDAGDLEWHWMDDEIVDPEVRSRVVMAYRGGNGVKPIVTVDQARDMAALPPLTDQERAELEADSVPPIPEVSDNEESDASAENSGSATSNPQTSKKAARSGGRSLPALSRNTTRRTRVTKRLAKLAATVLGTQLAAIANALADDAQKYAKATVDDVASLIKEILANTWDDDAREKLWELLAELTQDRADAAMEQLRPYLTDERYAAALTQANERAVEWARHRVSNMITETNETTQQLVNELTSHAVETGLTNSELASLLRESFGFGEDRAMTIARTETAFADTAGTIEGYAASGIVEGMEWSADENACDDCAALDGKVLALDDDPPPLHPNCECGVAPVLTEEAAALIAD